MAPLGKDWQAPKSTRISYEFTSKSFSVVVLFVKYYKIAWVLCKRTCISNHFNLTEQQSPCCVSQSIIGLSSAITEGPLLCLLADLNPRRRYAIFKEIFVSSVLLETYCATRVSLRESYPKIRAHSPASTRTY